MFKCCCGSNPTRYKVKGCYFNTDQMTGFFALFLEGIRQLPKSTAYAVYPVASVEAEDVSRMFLKTTKVQTGNTGATKTVINEYSGPVRGTLSTSTSYSPDEGTFAADWAVRDPQNTGAISGGSPDVHSIGSTGGGNPWSDATTFETLVTPGAVFAGMKALVDAKSWDDVAAHVETGFGTKGANALIAYYDTLDDEFDWLPWSADELWYGEHPFPNSVGGLSSATSGGAYGFTSIYRVQRFVSYMILVAQIDGEGCLQKIEFDANYCPTVTDEYRKDVDELVAEAVSWEGVIPEAPTFFLGFWEYLPADAVTQRVATALVSRAGALHSTVAGCLAGTENRFFTWGCRFSVPEDDDNTCPEPPP